MNSKGLARRIALAAATIGFVPLATLCNLAVPAAGADFGQPFPGLAPPPAADRVEFASNWYVRGDLAYAQETYPNIAPGSPSVLNTFSAGVGGGYKVNNYFRTDLILDYRSPIHAAGTARRRTAPSRQPTPMRLQLLSSCQRPAPVISIAKLTAGTCWPTAISISAPGMASPLI